VRWPAALRRVDADAVLFPYSLGAAVSGRARRFSFVHDCIMERDVRFAPDRRTRWLYMLHTAVVAHRTRVLTRSEAAARDIERFYRVPVKAWQVVPGGVELDFGSLAAPDRRIAGAELPATYLLHVGARRPHKNVVTLVRALALLPPDHHLVLVGAVDDRVPDPVPRVARELGVADRVLHLPRVSEADLHTLYAAARVFTFPSLDEGLGLPLLEAMVVGVPVVASDIPVFREVSGGGALLVPPEDPAAWASAVRAVEEPGRRQALVAAGRAQVRRSTWDLTVDRLVAALLHG
jgi:glycosyltransferase involved in cell wall biosynthesis